MDWYNSIMSNKIRTKDLISYFTQLLVYWSEVNAEQNALYEKAREKYKTTIWSRWFGRKFESSDCGSLHWLHTLWDDLIYSKEHMKDCQKSLEKCEYFHKCGNDVMEWAFEDFSERKFYTWCKENNIPY